MKMTNNSNHTLENYINLAAILLELPITPESQPGVLEHFANLDKTAKQVMEFPLSDDTEPAPIFEP